MKYTVSVAKIAAPGLFGEMCEYASVRIGYYHKDKVYKVEAYSYLPNGEKFELDDDNIAGRWYGIAENPFRYIQDGIDAASSGDAICVFPGIYNENILIDKNDLTIKPDI